MTNRVDDNEKDIEQLELNDLKRELKILKYSLGLSSIWYCLKRITKKCWNIVGIFTSDREVKLVVIIAFGYFSGVIPMLSIIASPIVSIYRYIAIKKEIEMYEV